jgi:response regulator RpfG family c-di-GMP phosphodiesterase
MNRIINELELHHPATIDHQNRVAGLISQLPIKLGMREKELIVQAAKWHDAGKLWLPRDVLDKTGNLTQEEVDVMHLHPLLGAERVQDKTIQRIILHHHERWDGTGYPIGLHGESIPLGARILAIVDTFDAMTSNRPYKSYCTGTSALQEIQSQAGKQFDPQLCQDIIPEWLLHFANHQASAMFGLPDALRSTNQGVLGFQTVEKIEHYQTA